MLDTQRYLRYRCPRLWRFRPHTALRINARTRLKRDWQQLQQIA